MREEEGPARRLGRAGRMAAAAAVALAAAAVPADAPSGDGSGARVRVVHATCDTGDADRPCRFRPRRITVPAGTRVRWVDDEATYHTVTATRSLRRKRPSGAFEGVLARRGETYSRTFRRPGTYRYYCRPHAAFMEGIVRVTRRR
jgi:plastocyanin